MVYINNSDELYHYGVKGMRWGHRKASYQNTATSGNSAARQKYLDAKANKKAANKTYKKAFNKAYDNSWKQFTKKQRAANDARWDDAAEKGKAANAADKAFKQAKKEYHQTDEYKAKRAKAIKVGAAVAGTALAAYGAYKVSKFVRNKAALKSDRLGREKVAKFLKDAQASASAGNIQRANISTGMARSAQSYADARTNKVYGSTVEAAKYLWKTRRA